MSDLWALGDAVLTTAIVLVGPLHEVGGHAVANLTAYRVAFLVGAAFALLAVPCALSIRDADAARTIPGRGGMRAAGSSRKEATDGGSAAPADPVLTD